jgi:hypothetical protein
MLYDDRSSDQVAPAQNLRRCSGTSPVAVSKYHLSFPTSYTFISYIKVSRANFVIRLRTYTHVHLESLAQD